MRLLGRARGTGAGKAMPTQAMAASPLCSAPPAPLLAALTGCVSHHILSPATAMSVQLPSQFLSASAPQGGVAGAEAVHEDLMQGCGGWCDG